MTVCPDGCGDCCDPVWLHPDAHALLTSYVVRPAEVANGNAAWARDLVPLGDDEYACPRFDTTTRLCGDYEGRPAICSDYPWYGAPPKASAGLNARCVFWSEVPVALNAGTVAAS